MGTMYQAFQSDEDAERKGIIVDYGDFRVTLARAGGANKAFQRALERLSRPVRRAIQTDSLDNDRATLIMRQAYVETVIRDWEVKQHGKDEKAAPVWVKGIEAQDGSVLPFTKENLLATFDALPDLFRDIMEQAQNAALYRAALREEALGN